MEQLSWKNVITEKELQETLGIGKNTLARLRAKGLPYLTATNRARVYLDTEILEWLQKHRAKEKDVVSHSSEAEK